MVVKLPDADEPRLIPSAQRGVISGAMPDIGRVLTALGNQLTAQGEQTEARADRFAYERAKAQVLTASIEAESALDSDNDFGTYEKRYAEQMAKVRTAALGQIQDPYLREIFDLETDTMAQRGVASVRAKSRAKERDFGRATLMEQLDANRRAALMAGDADSRALLGNAGGLIAGAQEKGYLSAEEATANRMKFVQSYAVDRMQMRPVEEQIRLLTGKEGAPRALLEMAGEAGAKHGVDGLVLARIAMLESGGKTQAVNPKSGAAGLFQFMPETAQAYKLTDPGDAEAAADAAARLLKDNQNALARRLGRTPLPAELYLAHQQGAGGAAALLSDPEGNVVDVLSAAYKGNRSKALAAIEQNGGNAEMTAGQFADMWKARYDAAGLADGIEVSTVSRTGTEADFLPPDVRFEMLAKARAQFEKQAELSAALGQYGNPDFLYDPGNKDHRDAVDKIFTAQGGVQAMRSMSEEGAQALVSVAQRTGIMPAPAQGTLRAMMENGSVEAKAYAYDVVARLQEDAPRVLDQFKESEISQATLYNKYIRTGMDQPTALKYVDANFNPMNAEVREMRAASLKPFMKDQEKKLADTFTDLFDPGFFTTGPDLPRNSAAADQAIATYRSALETEYMMHGDEDVAKARAAEQVRRIYGETRVTGKRTIMRRPPEMYYAVPGVDNEWMQGQLLKDVRAISGEEDAEPEGLELMADAVTEADISAGKLPRYQVLRARDGIWDALRDESGKVLYYTFDRQPALDELAEDQKAERKRVLELGRVYRDIAKQGWGEPGQGIRSIVPEAVPRAAAWAKSTLGDTAPSKQKRSGAEKQRAAAEEQIKTVVKGVNALPGMDGSYERLFGKEE